MKTRAWFHVEVDHVPGGEGRRRLAFGDRESDRDHEIHQDFVCSWIHGDHGALHDPWSPFQWFDEVSTGGRVVHSQGSAVNASTDPSADGLFEVFLDRKVKSILGTRNREDPEAIRDGFEQEDGCFIDGWQERLRGRF